MRAAVKRHLPKRCTRRCAAQRESDKGGVVGGFVDDGKHKVGSSVESNVRQERLRDCPVPTL